MLHRITIAEMTFKVTQRHEDSVIRQITYNFLLVFRSNYISILYRYQDFLPLVYEQ